MESRGVFWPMSFEADVPECRVVQGEIPKDLYGGLYHNGPTVRHPQQQGVEGVFTTDGMVQGLLLENGRAKFKNRWVRTPKFMAESAAGRSLFAYEDCKVNDWRAMGLGDVIRTPENAGISPNTAMVNAFPFGDEVFAVGELVGSPMALDPITLETKGFPKWADELGPSHRQPVSWDDKSMSPHPKWDVDTKMLYAWSYRDKAPFVTLHWVMPDGTTQSRDLWDAPYGTVAHDAWLSENYFILPFQPFTLSLERANSGGSGYGWDVNLPIVMAIINRFDINSEVRYIKADMPAQYMMHMLSANEVGTTIQLDGPLFGRPPFQTADMAQPGDPFIPFFQVAPSKLGRWTINLESGSVTSEVLDDVLCELPKIDERFFGKPYEWGNLVVGSPSDSREGAMRMDSLMRRNMRTGDYKQIRLTTNRHETPFEPAFIPRRLDSAEGDGYLIVPVSKFKEHLGEFMIFDTDDISDGPICRIELPFHMGWTPHGHWMDFRDVDSLKDVNVFLES